MANNAHRPEHLTDGDLSTAWNSRTGALAGRWISIDLPTSTRLSALKLTVGFTATGPNSDDWFTMNHRVSRIRLLVDQKEVGEFKLDPNVRALQSVALDTEGKSIRMELLDVSTGSKKNWREACISELELWGRASAPANGVRPIRWYVSTIADRVQTRLAWSNSFVPGRRKRGAS